MTPDRLLDILARTGADIGLDPAGHLVTANVPPELAHLIDQHQDELTLAVHGARTGHRWHTCTHCRLSALITKSRRCDLTPACPGKLWATADHPDPHGLPCDRPGCDRPATVITHRHQAVCAADLTHLAHHQETAR